MDYRVSFRTARATQRNPVSKTKQANKQTRETERDRETDGDGDVANTNAQ